MDWYKKKEGRDFAPHEVSPSFIPQSYAAAELISVLGSLFHAVLLCVHQLIINTSQPVCTLVLTVSPLHAAMHDCFAPASFSSATQTVSATLPALMHMGVCVGPWCQVCSAHLQVLQAV